ncbi:MAG: class I SAM-dependent methyltransferase [Spirochaetaceae bacterium]|jgi:23S rRNA G2069 N7-methylase RlmK/C1962 C5-methylase RlmI|nr:class I SAM-dependent methyltransferase [Spirochaetaceae bacterium]
MSRGQEHIKEQAAMFAGRLRKRKRHLAKWARREGTGVYRLYDRDIPEIPLVLDYYEGMRNGVLEHALFGALYKRPYEKDAAEESAWLLEMKKAAQEVLSLSEDAIFIKERKRISPFNQYHKDTAARNFELDVREGGLLFRVNLSGYIDCGLYHDARKVRARAAAEAPGKTVLNLFCYTGAFSVYAAAMGAASVDSVDLSAVCLKRAAVNFMLNGLEHGGAFRFIRCDVLEFLENARGRRWDIIILNPPVFSNSKKTTHVLDLKHDYPQLLRLALALLAPGGSLYFGARLRGLSPCNEQFAPLYGNFPGLVIEDITEKSRCEDFSKHRIPAWLLFKI